MRNGLITNKEGDKLWYKNDLLDREDGPAAIYSFGEFWYKKGFLHRLGGPAIIEYNFIYKWYKEGNLHRTDGPAVEYMDFKYKNSYYYEGEPIKCRSTKEFIRIINLKIFW